METKYIIALIIGISIYISTITGLFKVYKPSIKAKKEKNEQIKKERERLVKAKILEEEKETLDKSKISKEENNSDSVKKS